MRHRHPFAVDTLRAGRCQIERDGIIYRDGGPLVDVWDVNVATYASGARNAGPSRFYSQGISSLAKFSGSVKKPVCGGRPFTDPKRWLSHPQRPDGLIGGRALDLRPFPAQRSRKAGSTISALHRLQCLHLSLESAARR